MKDRYDAEYRAKFAMLARVRRRAFGIRTPAGDIGIGDSSFGLFTVLKAVHTS